MTIRFLILTIVILGSLPTFAQTTCGPDKLYKERVDLPNGQVLFRDPGLYTSQGEFYKFSVGSEDPGTSICQKYLGMSSYVNLSTKYTAGTSTDHMYYGSNNQLNFAQDTSYIYYITEITCL